MKQLGERIVDSRLPGASQQEEIFRTAVRGIILKGDQVLLVYSTHYDDYSFPGGGLETGETEEECVRRECLEEVGAVIHEIIPYYSIVEERFTSVGKPTQLFESKYYLCAYEELQTELHLEEYEVELGYQPVWISVQEAIEHNERIIDNLLKYSHYTGVVERELRILRQLLKDKL